MEASGRCGRRGKFGTLPGVVGAVPLEGVGDRKEMLLPACCCWLLSWYSALGGRKGTSMCASCKDPGLSGYLTWYFHVDGVHTGTGGHGQTRHGWIQDELGPAAATATATAVRDTHTHKKSPRGMTAAATLVQPAP